MQLFQLPARFQCHVEGPRRHHLICTNNPSRISLNRTFNLNGFALIVSSFLSFGVYHADSKASPNQWQWLMIIESLITFMVFLLFYFYFPDNPTTASFLTEEEKIIAVKRLQGNQNGIETKVWKKHQYVTLSWLFSASL